MKESEKSVLPAGLKGKAFVDYMQAEAAMAHVMRQRAQMVHSLYDAIKSAGGDPESILTPSMTLQELVDQLAQNGVRFTYVGPNNR